MRKECANCGVRQAEAAFGAAAWKARHVDRRVCRACARKQRGWWQCHTCYVRKEPSQFSTWLAKRTAGQDGRQICNGCKALQVACRYAGRANHRLARLRARAAQNRVHDRLPAPPADATASGSELERRRRLVAETWAEITARQGETTERTQKKRKTETPASDEKLYREVQAKKQHEYACPHCGGLVASNVTTGQIDHRTVCGNRFNVSDGRVKEQQKHKYTCPHCEGLVASNVLTGQIDHRTVCGNRFNVSDGRVKEQRKHEYTCPHCGGLVASNVMTGQIDHWRVCGNRFCVRNGTVQEKKKHQYTCPHCGGLVASNLTTGQIDHRTVCGNRFYVTAGKVKDQKKHAQKTRGKK